MSSSSSTSLEFKSNKSQPDSFELIKQKKLDAKNETGTALLKQLAEAIYPSNSKVNCNVINGLQEEERKEDVLKYAPDMAQHKIRATEICLVYLREKIA